MAQLVVDTGASLSAIDDTILASLELRPTGTTRIHTPSTAGVPHSVGTYDVSFRIFGANGLVHEVPVLGVVAGSFKAQGVDGLLGRDVLVGARVTYSGPDRLVMLSF